MDPAQEGFDPERRGVPDEVITTEVDISEVIDRKIKAFQCHRSQLSPDGPPGRVTYEVLQESMGVEYLQKAVAGALLSEAKRGLFAGLRTSLV